MADASRRVEDQEAEFESERKEEDKEEPETNPEEGDEKVKKEIIVSQSVRLDNRIIDLRVPANKAIMKM